MAEVTVKYQSSRRFENFSSGSQGSQSFKPFTYFLCLNLFFLLIPVFLEYGHFAQVNKSSRFFSHVDTLLQDDWAKTNLKEGTFWNLLCREGTDFELWIWGTWGGSCPRVFWDCSVRTREGKSRSLILRGPAANRERQKVSHSNERIYSFGLGIQIPFV